MACRHASKGAMLRSVVLPLVVVVMLAPRADARAQTPPPTPTLAESIAHIDDDPDILHNDVTPAVWAICAHELDGARAVMPLLDAADRDTRMHASRALSCAVSRWLGWRAGQGYPPGAEARFRSAWTANGDYDWDADAAARHASRLAWERWLAAQPATPR
jgi:hypothetical protein